MIARVADDPFHDFTNSFEIRFIADQVVIDQEDPVDSPPPVQPRISSASAVAAHQGTSARWFLGFTPVPGVVTDEGKRPVRDAAKDRAFPAMFCSMSRTVSGLRTTLLR